MRKGKEVRNGNEHEKERENEKKALFLTGVPRAADEAGRLGAGLEQPRQSLPDLVHDGEEGGVHVAEERERCWWLKKKRLVEVEEVEVEIALLMPPFRIAAFSLSPPLVPSLFSICACTEASFIILYYHLAPRAPAGARSKDRDPSECAWGRRWAPRPAFLPRGRPSRGWSRRCARRETTKP